MKALRELVMKWELTANSKPATEGGDYAANALTDCAAELEAALDACPTLPDLVKELRENTNYSSSWNRCRSSIADRIEAALNGES